MKGGIGLAFISYPAAVLQMDVSPLWSFLFFFMLVNLAMSSLCGGFQTFLGFVMDEWPNLRPHRIKLTIGFSVLYFLLGTKKFKEAQSNHDFMVFIKSFKPS